MIENHPEELRNISWPPKSFSYLNLLLPPSYHLVLVLVADNRTTPGMSELPTKYAEVAMFSPQSSLQEYPSRKENDLYLTRVIVLRLDVYILKPVKKYSVELGVVDLSFSRYLPFYFGSGFLCISSWLAALLCYGWYYLSSLWWCIVIRLKGRTSLDLFWYLKQLFIKLVASHGAARVSTQVSKEQWNKCKSEVLAHIFNFSSSAW